MIHRLNKTILACVLLLAGMGLLSLWCTAPVTDFSGTAITKSIFLKQVTFMTAAFAVMGLVALPHYHYYRRAAYLVYALGCVSLLGLLVVGQYTKGARGWFSLGPINVQPAEFMKIGLVLALARVLMNSRTIHTWKGLFWPTAVLALPSLLVVVQPDLGTTLLFIPMFFAMLYAAGARRLHLALIILMLVLAAPVMYLYGMKEYQRNRLIAFALPDKVPPAMSYQVRQSVKACASGSALGKGLGESDGLNRYYIPDRHTDFVYSIIAEDLGFMGCTFVLLLFAVYFAQGFRIAHQSRDPFGRLAVVGLMSILGFQTCVNLGVTLGVAPVTGVTLPFVSYGGSSLLVCAVATGITLNVGARWQPGFSSRDMAGSVEISNFQPQAIKWLSH
jgi:rod shape determining protein RodA